MLRLSEFTKTLLLATSFLLLTACDSKTNTNTTDEQNPTSQVNTYADTDDSGTNSGGDGNTTTDRIDNDYTTMGSGSDDNISTSGGDNDNNNPLPTVTLKALTLTIDKITLNKDENTTVKVMATYEDGTSKEVTEKAEWVVSPKESVSISNNTLKALKDARVSLQAKLDTKLSKKVNLNITWIVNGHTLPPEPDKAVNDATLLGVDVNGNEVRDDVERWIYQRFSKDTDYPKTKISIAMQYAKAYQFIITNDPKNAFANKSYEKEDYALDCKWYWYDEVTKNLSSLDGRKYRLQNKIYDEKMESKLFNTKDRMKMYFYYNSSLSGHMLGGGGGVLSSTKDKCNFDIESLEEL